VRKLALVLAAALFGAAVPTMTASGAPVSSQATAASVRFINLMNTNTAAPAATQPIDICVDGVKVADNLAVATHVDTTVNAGAAGVVIVASSDANANCSTATQSTTLSMAPVVGGSNVTIAVNDASGGWITPGTTVGPTLESFTNDLSATANGLARFQVHNQSPQSADICIAGVKPTGLANIAPGGSGEAEVAAATPPSIAIVSPAGGACSTGTAVPLPGLAAGSNTVFTIGVSLQFNAFPPNPNGSNIIGSTACGKNPADPGACVQVFQVGQGRPVNSAATAAFCAALNPGLTGIQAEIKSVLGGIDPTSAATVTATKPSTAAVQKLVNDINSIVAAGDASVPATVLPQWETVTAGLRKLATGLTSAGFDVSNIPLSDLKTIVDGANGVNQTANPANDAATAVLTNFFLTNCVAAAVPKFTG
jgi:hypothetical protein